jgi:hypothetical protein
LHKSHEIRERRKEIFIQGTEPGPSRTSDRGVRLTGLPSKKTSPVAGEMGLLYFAVRRTEENQPICQYFCALAVTMILKKTILYLLKKCRRTKKMASVYIAAERSLACIIIYSHHAILYTHNVHCALPRKKKNESIFIVLLT